MIALRGPRESRHSSHEESDSVHIFIEDYLIRCVAHAMNVRVSVYTAFKPLHDMKVKLSEYSNACSSTERGRGREHYVEVLL